MSACGSRARTCFAGAVAPVIRAAAAEIECRGLGAVVQTVMRVRARLGLVAEQPCTWRYVSRQQDRLPLRPLHRVRAAQVRAVLRDVHARRRHPEAQPLLAPPQGLIGQDDILIRRAGFLPVKYA
jgi:hypothetical protein